MIWLFSLYCILAVSFSVFCFFRHPGGKGVKYKVNTLSAFQSARTTSFAPLIMVAIPLLMAEDNGETKVILASVFALIGLLLVFIIGAKRIRIYSEVFGFPETFPEYTEKRYCENKGYLRITTAVITIFAELLTASYLISVSSVIMSEALNLDRIVSVIVICILTGTGVCLGGLQGSIMSDVFRGLVAFASMAIFIVFSVKTDLFADMSNKIMSPADIFGLFSVKSMSVPDWITCASFLFLFAGMPRIYTRLMHTAERKPSLGLRCLMSAIPVAAIAGAVILISTCGKGITGISEYYKNVFGAFPEIISAIALFGIFCCLMSSVDGAVACCSSSFTNDIYKPIMSKVSERKEYDIIEKLASIVIVFFSALIILSNKETEFISLEFLIAAETSAFGPVTIFSLYSDKITAKGAIASEVSGFIMAFLVKYFGYLAGIVFPGSSVVFGTALSVIVLWGVSLLDKKHISEKSRNEYGRVRLISKMR